MNPVELTRLAKAIELSAEDRFDLRVAFGVACMERVEHLLTNDSMIEALAVGKAFVAGECNLPELRAAAKKALEVARSHPGSNSLDGAGSAAVSTSHGVVAALAGRALEAAEYAAYASVYSYASYAVTDLSAYEEEHAWQVMKLRELAEQRGQVFESRR